MIDEQLSSAVSDDVDFGGWEGRRWFFSRLKFGRGLTVGVGICGWERTLKSHATRVHRP